MKGGEARSLLVEVCQGMEVGDEVGIGVQQFGESLEEGGKFVTWLHGIIALRGLKWDVKMILNQILVTNCSSPCTYSQPLVTSSPSHPHVNGSKEGL